MKRYNARGTTLIGLGIFFGLAILGYLLASAAIEVKEYERTVTAKGLSEKEFAADVAVWPIRFSVAGNDLILLSLDLEKSAKTIYDFLLENGVKEAEISIGAPAIQDRSAEIHTGRNPGQLRYTASQAVTVYAGDVEKIRALAGSLVALGKKGVVISGGGYRDSIEYIFTRLNEVKPEMVKDAVANARQVARQFAEHSESRLGKIKRASQGQFSISPRDRNTPHIKKVRVVSTVEYYLVD